jgi:hypothetical protein
MRQLFLAAVSFAKESVVKKESGTDQSWPPVCVGTNTAPLKHGIPNGIGEFSRKFDRYPTRIYELQVNCSMKPHTKTKNTTYTRNRLLQPLRSLFPIFTSGSTRADFVAIEGVRDTEVPYDRPHLVRGTGGMATDRERREQK